MRLILTLITFGVLFSCKQTPNNQNSSSSNEVVQEIASENLDNEDASNSTGNAVELDDVHEEVIENQRNSLDSIQGTLELWNTGLNEKSPQKLANVYAGEVQFYKQSRLFEEVIEMKIEALRKAPDYCQKMEAIQVQYPSDKESVVRCVFDKTYKTGGKENTVSAVIEMQLINGTYRIIKESDQATELALINEAETRGVLEYTFFSYHYWLDTRDDNVLAHDFVPYYMELGFDPEKMEISMHWYSGSLRSITDFAVADIFMEDGYLSFKASAISTFDENPTFDKDDYQTFTFKCLDGELALINNDGWFSDLEGIRLSVVED